MQRGLDVRNRLLLPALLALFAALVLAAAGCGDDDSTSADSTTAANVSLDDCQADSLDTLSAGTLTVGTDKPAYPPYFEDNDPTNGEGFESAVAYAIADQLGFSSDQVEWTVVPFNSSYAPGPKDFDFDVNQISITPKRAEAVDFSAPYYEADQAIVALSGSDLADATSLADFQDANIGVQIGTTSLEAVDASIQPSSDPAVFDTSNDVVTALKQEQVDAIVVDVPTAFYLTAVQVPDGEIVGQFPAPGGDQWGALLAKDSPLTDCVSAAIEELDASGELAEIQKTWIDDKTKAPVLE
jgi:polar amino acid transport system substrate-binding protein